MLKHITIKDFAIVDALDLDLRGGMTVVTGETGAGKSIMLDALSLCLGDRADSRTVRPGAKRADITAVFDLTALPQARSWLAERDLDEDDSECLLRRTVNNDGRSKAYINGRPSTLSECSALGELLVDLHSQHAHQSLLRKSQQRALLDARAGATGLASDVAKAARHCQALIEEYAQLSGQSEAASAQRELLRYQVNELEELALSPGEIEKLEAEQKTLANAGYLLESTAMALQGCEQQAEDVGRLKSLLADERHDAAQIANIRELIDTAAISLDEARAEIERYAGRLEMDPERLSEVEARLDTIYELARKHRVQPEELPAHHEQLQRELDGIDGDDARLSTLQADIDSARASYRKLAAKLTKTRVKAAKSLATRVTDELGRLSMERCRFEVALTTLDEQELHAKGAEDVEFLISTQPGVAPGSLGRIASGGELSRISLALQVAAADNATAPTMIFDEVDVGIGGAVAEVVGELLHQLSERVQVLCVTHLPQVAAKGDHHLRVSKAGDENAVTTGVETLDSDSRITEIARMLGGKKLTDSTLAHAREMLGKS